MIASIPPKKHQIIQRVCDPEADKAMTTTPIKSNTYKALFLALKRYLRSLPPVCALLPLELDFFQGLLATAKVQKHRNYLICFGIFYRYDTMFLVSKNIVSIGQPLMDSFSSVTRVSYWDNILLSHKAEKIIPDDILQKFCTYINNGEYHTLDLDEKYRITIDGVHWVVRSARLSDAKRVLFTDQGPNLIILDYLPNHEYSKSAVMESQWFRQFVSSRLGRHQRPEDFIQVVMDPLPMAPSMAIPRGAVYSYNHVDFNFLDSHQSHILSSDLPIITVGPAGTGKTLASRELFYSRIEGHLYSSDLSEVLNLAYFTSARALSNNERKIAERQSFADSPWVHIDYWYDELRYPLGQTTYRTALLAWTRKQIQETPILDSLSPEQLLEEFDLLFVLQHIAGKAQAPTLYTDPRDGFARAKLFPHKEKQLPVVLSLFSMFIAEFFENPRQPYVQGFRSALPTDKIYAVATYDESQNATLSEIYEAFVLCQGRLSILYDPKQAQKGLGRDTVSLFENIVNQLHPFHRSFQPRLELQQNYRCGLKQLELCNQLLRLRAWALKGVTIKDEAPLINLPIQDHANGSRVFWYNSFEDTHYQTEILPHLSKDSADWATITDPSYFSEVRTYIGEEPILMGYQQIPGVEFKVTQIYHPIHPDLLTPELLEFLETALDPTAPLPISLAKLENRTKYAEVLKWIGQIFTAITRSMHTTIIIQPDVQLKHKKVFRKLVQLLALPQSLDRTQKMLISLTGSSIARWQEVVLGLREDPVLAQNLYDRHLAQETGQTFTEWLSFIAPAIDESPTLQIDTSMPYSETLSCSSASASASTSTEITPTSSIRRNKPRKKSSATSPKLDYAQLKKHVLIFCQAKRASDLKALQNCSALHLVNMLFLETLLPSSTMSEYIVAEEYSPSNISVFEMYMQSPSQKHAQSMLEKILMLVQCRDTQLTIISDDFFLTPARSGLLKILENTIPEVRVQPSSLACSTFEGMVALSLRSGYASTLFQRLFHHEPRKPIAPNTKSTLRRLGLAIKDSPAWVVPESGAAFYSEWKAYMQSICPEIFESLKLSSSIAPTSQYSSSIDTASYVDIDCRENTAAAIYSPPLKPVSTYIEHAIIIDAAINKEILSYPKEVQNALCLTLQALESIITSGGSAEQFKAAFLEGIKNITEQYSAHSSSSTLNEGYMLSRFVQIILGKPLQYREQSESNPSGTPYSLLTLAQKKDDDIVLYLLKYAEAGQIYSEDNRITAHSLVPDSLLTHYGSELLSLHKSLYGQSVVAPEARRRMTIYTFIVSFSIQLGAHLNLWLETKSHAFRVLRRLLSDKFFKALSAHILNALADPIYIDSPLDPIAIIALESSYVSKNPQTPYVLEDNKLSLLTLALKNGNLAAAKQLLYYKCRVDLLHSTEGTALYHAVKMFSTSSIELERCIYSIINSLEALPQERYRSYIQHAENSDRLSVAGVLIKMRSNNLESDLECSSTDIKIFHRFFSIGANPLEILENGQNPRNSMLLACSMKDPALLNSMIDSLLIFPSASSLKIFQEPEKIGLLFEHPIFYAFRRQHWALVRVFLEKQCPLLYACSNTRATLLILASRENVPNDIAHTILRTIQSSRYSPSQRLEYTSFQANPTSENALSNFISAENISSMKILFDIGVTLKIPHLKQAIETKNVEVTLALLSYINTLVRNGIWTSEKQKEYINTPFARGPYSPLVEVINTLGDSNVVTMFLEMGAKISYAAVLCSFLLQGETITCTLIKHLSKTLAPEKFSAFLYTHSFKSLSIFNKAMNGACFSVADTLLDISVPIEDIALAFSNPKYYLSTLDAPLPLFNRMLEILKQAEKLPAIFEEKKYSEHDNKTPCCILEHTIRRNYPEQAISLIQYGADPLLNFATETSLILACFDGAWDLANQIISKLYASDWSELQKSEYLWAPFSPDNILPAMPALYFALKDDAVCDAILASPPAVTHIRKRTQLLAFAAQNSSARIFKKILDVFKDHEEFAGIINKSALFQLSESTENRKMSPLIATITSSNLEHLKFLRAYGANAVWSEPSELTPLMHAITTQNAGIFAEVLSWTEDYYGADREGLLAYLNRIPQYDSREAVGQSALSMAITIGAFRIAEQLVDAGADGHLKEAHLSPFQLAIRSAPPLLVSKMLLQKTFDEQQNILSSPYQYNQSGNMMTPMLHALEHNDRVASALLQYGLHHLYWHSREPLGQSALIIATIKHSEPWVKRILARLPSDTDLDPTHNLCPAFLRANYLNLTRRHPSFPNVSFSAIGFALLTKQTNITQQLIAAGTVLYTNAIIGSYGVFTGSDLLHSCTSFLDPMLYKMAIDSQPKELKEMLLRMPVNFIANLSTICSSEKTLLDVQLQPLKKFGSPLAFWIESADEGAPHYVDFLIEQGASIYDRADSQPPLFLAAIHEKYDLLKTMLQHLRTDKRNSPSYKLDFLNQRFPFAKSPDKIASISEVLRRFVPPSPEVTQTLTDLMEIELFLLKASRNEEYPYQAGITPSSYTVISAIYDGDYQTADHMIAQICQLTPETRQPILDGMISLSMFYDTAYSFLSFALSRASNTDARNLVLSLLRAGARIDAVTIFCFSMKQSIFDLLCLKAHAQQLEIFECAVSTAISRNQSCIFDSYTVSAIEYRAPLIVECMAKPALSAHFDILLKYDVSVWQKNEANESLLFMAIWRFESRSHETVPKILLSVLNDSRHSHREKLEYLNNALQDCIDVIEEPYAKSVRLVREAIAKLHANHCEHYVPHNPITHTPMPIALSGQLPRASKTSVENTSLPVDTPKASPSPPGL